MDKPIQLILEGEAGKRVAFERSGVVTEITTICDGNTESDNTSLPPGGDCKISIGSNLFVWIKHFTKFATFVPSSGGGGGGGGSNAKPELLSLEFSSVESGILKELASFEVGEDVDVEISFNDGNGLGMQHVEIISPNFSIEYDKYKPLVVYDQNQFLMEEPKVRVINEGTQSDVSFRLQFAKTLPESDITIKAWNTDRNSIQETFENAWEIIPSTTPQPETIIIPEPTVDPEPSFSWGIFNQWAGYSTEEVTDSDFLSHLGYDGEKIPYWFKKNNAKWLKDELISQEDIVNAIEFLVKKGYTKI